ncbi:MAG: phosphotransferase [Candidatus Thorarchaeota archaeon]
MDSSKFLTYLREKYPERQDLMILNLKNITSGWETEIESFDLEWISDDGGVSQALVVRIFPGKGAASKADKEYRVMKQLQDIEYPVPTVYLIETDESIIGGPFIIMDRLDGGTLDETMNQSDETREIWSKVFCQLFVDLHRADWRVMVSDDEQNQFEDPFFITKSGLTHYRNILEESGVLDFLPIVEWMEERRKMVPCETPSITHNDFHGFNIMLDRNEIPFVIDWGASRVTDSRYDLAWTLLLYFAYGNMGVRNNLLKGYEMAAGKHVDQIEFFEVYACLRRLHDISSSLSKGAEEIGLRPGAVQMMRESVGHIINVRNRLKDLTGIVIPSIDNMIEELSKQ